jgi:hypothetical protein
MHYSTGTDQVACGRSSANASAQPDQVTCKTCLRSAAYNAAASADAGSQVQVQGVADVAAQAPAAKAQPVEQSVVTYRTRSVAFEEWQGQLANGSRLPRGRHFKNQQKKIAL